MNKNDMRAIPKEWCNISKVFTALGDEHRQRILPTFSPGECLSVGRIVAVSTLSRSAVSKVAVVVTPPGRAADHAQARGGRRAHGYGLSHLRIAPLERIGARLFASHVSSDDHSPAEKQSRLYQVVTVESVIRFVARAPALAARAVVRLQ